MYLTFVLGPPISLALAATITSSSSVQLLSTDPTLDFHCENPEVVIGYSVYSGDKCTLFEVSCTWEER